MSRKHRNILLFSVYIVIHYIKIELLHIAPSDWLEVFTPAFYFWTFIAPLNLYQSDTIYMYNQHPFNYELRKICIRDLSAKLKYKRPYPFRMGWSNQLNFPDRITASKCMIPSFWYFGVKGDSNSLKMQILIEKTLQTNHLLSWNVITPFCFMCTPHLVYHALVRHAKQY